MENLQGGKYRLFLDFGDSALVKAENKATGEIVALKRLQAGREEGMVELKVWRDVYSDDFRGNFLDKGWLYIERIWLEGETLREKVEKSVLEVAEAVKIAILVAKETKFLYDRTGLIHGDIKPDNIIITSTGVRLIDFESARLENNHKDRKENANKTVKFVSPGFSAPEKLRGKETSLSDVYSIGMLLVFMTTGNTEKECVPGDLQSVIQMSTADDAESRIQSIDVMITELEKTLEIVRNAKSTDRGGVLFPNVVFGYRRLIIYVSGPMAFASEMAVKMAEKGIQVGFCEVCDLSEGISKYYLGRQQDSGDILKPNYEDFAYMAGDPGVSYGDGELISFDLEEEMLGDFAYTFNGNGNLKFTTKKIPKNTELENGIMRDFMVKCYSDFDVTVLYDNTERSSENRAQLMRFCDFVLVPLEADVDLFEDGFKRWTSFMMGEGVPIKRLKIVGWNFCDSESTDESLMKLVACDHYLGYVEKDTKRKSTMNITGGYYVENMPENIGFQYDNIISKIICSPTKSA